MREVDAVLRKEYHIDPDILEDNEWCKLYADYLHIVKINFLNTKAAILSAAAEILGDASEDTVDIGSD